MARSYGRGSVYEDGGRWIFAWSEGSGKTRKRRKRVFDSEAEANAYRRRHSHSSEGRRGEYSDRPLKDWCKRWLDDYPGKDGTKYGYEKHVNNRINPYIGHIRLRDLTPERVSRWLKRMPEKGVAPSSVLGAFVALRACLGRAVRMNQTSDNPCLRVIPPSYKSPKRKALGPETLVRFFEAVRGRRLEALGVLVPMTGIREGEAFALHWPDIDFERKTVKIDKNVVVVKNRFVFQTPKGGSRAIRTLDLPDDAVLSLLEHRERMRAEGRDVENGLVFPSEIRTRQSPLRCESMLKRFLYPAFRQAGIPTGRKGGVTMHDLRHTYATIAKEAGEEIDKISRALGHSNTIITDIIYNHSWERPVVGVGGSVAEALQRAREEQQGKMAPSMAPAGAATSQPAAQAR